VGEPEPSKTPGAWTIPSQVLTQFYDDSAVLLDTETLEYLELDDTAAAMWRAISSTETAEAALDQLLALYEAPRDVVAADLQRLADWLVEAGYLAAADTPTTAEMPQPAAPSNTGDGAPGSAPPADLRGAYIELLMRSLCGVTQASLPIPTAQQPMAHLGHRAHGTDLPPHAMTMIGLQRMRNIRDLVATVLAEDIPGDLMECGVWRGGATIFMRGLLRAYGVQERSVWVADSFVGLPSTKTDEFPLDQEWTPMTGALAVPLETVRRNFAVFDLLDEQVKFLPGWFADTLPGAPIEQIAVLRLDGDLQESTWSALEALYDRVAPGGFVIIDDYVFESCRQAVEDFRLERGIDDPIQHADWTGVWWRKGA